MPSDPLPILTDFSTRAEAAKHAHVDARALSDTIRQAQPAASLLATRLVDMANQGGGSDNCTVVAVRTNSKCG